MSTTINGKNNGKINGKINGKTDHKYYCEAYEVGCNRFEFESFKEYKDEGKFRFIYNTEDGFYKRRIDVSKLILFRFDITEYDDDMILQLHYGDPNEFKGLYHDVIKITRKDFPKVEKLLKKAYKKLEDSFKNETICKDPPLYTDTRSVKEIVEGNKGYNFDWNLPYHFKWYKNEQNQLCITICFAGQRHGRDQWIARVENISTDEERKMKEFLWKEAFNYLRNLWVEVI